MSDSRSVFSRVIVGWSVADHMRSELVVDVLQMATLETPPGARRDRPRRPRQQYELEPARPRRRHSVGEKVRLTGRYAAALGSRVPEPSRMTKLLRGIAGQRGSLHARVPKQPTGEPSGEGTSTGFGIRCHRSLLVPASSPLRKSCRGTTRADFKPTPTRSPMGSHPSGECLTAPLDCLRQRCEAPCDGGGCGHGADIGPKQRSESISQNSGRRPLTCGFTFVAGAGFEPATSGL